MYSIVPTFSVSALFPALILIFHGLCKLGLESCSFENALRSPVLRPHHVSWLGCLLTDALLSGPSSWSSQRGMWKLDSAAADGGLKTSKEIILQPHTQRNRENLTFVGSHEVWWVAEISYWALEQGERSQIGTQSIFIYIKVKCLYFLFAFC